MYKAGDVVVNRRGDVVTLQEENGGFPRLFYRTTFIIFVSRADGECTLNFENHKEYDIVGYEKMTPKDGKCKHHDAIMIKKSDGQFAFECSDCKTTHDYKSNHINPEHYSRLSPEPLIVLEQWNLGNCKSNAIKYICRAGHKGDEVQDLRKAIEYLERKIGMIENGQNNNS